MHVVLKRELIPIKAGWSSKSTELGMTAHGYSPETADENLIHAVRLFFQPFYREGNLKEHVSALRLEQVNIDDGREGEIDIDLI
jgi:hypothetical protein